MCRVANGANSTGAVSPRVRIGCPDAARDSRPSSADLSRIFSTPITSTTSCTPLATAIAPTRNASDPEGHAFSMRVHGTPLMPSAVGTVLPAMPSWPHSVPRWVATNAASIAPGSMPLSTAPHAARNAPAAICSYDWSNSSPNLISPAPTSATRFQLISPALGFAGPLEPRSQCAGTGCLDARSRHHLFLVGRAVELRQDPGLPPVDRDAALVRVLPQHQLDLGADLDVLAVADHLQHDARAVLEIHDRDRQGRDERRRHRLVHHVGVH